MAEASEPAAPPAPSPSPLGSRQSPQSLFQSLQAFVPEIRLQYREYEDVFFKKIKDELLIMKEQPTVACGVAIAAGFLLMRGPRRFLFRQTLGRFRDKEAVFAKAVNETKELEQAVQSVKLETKKLLERASFAEQEIRSGRTKLKDTGHQIQGLVRHINRIESDVADFMDELREIPDGDALKLRKEESLDQMGWSIHWHSWRVTTMQQYSSSQISSSRQWLNFQLLICLSVSTNHFQMMSSLSGESLVRLLPLIGLSNISSFSLIGVLGILAPVSEEILYRGFLMTSLTKWLPPHVSIFLSSAVFTLAHQSPGKSLEIFIFGIVLGIVYAQTRNLLTPICMHAFWNLGVILMLTFLQLQGHEIQKYAL